MINGLNLIPTIGLVRVNPCKQSGPQLESILRVSAQITSQTSQTSRIIGGSNSGIVRLCFSSQNFVAGAVFGVSMLNVNTIHGVFKFVRQQHTYHPTSHSNKYIKFKATTHAKLAGGFNPSKKKSSNWITSPSKVEK